MSVTGRRSHAVERSVVRELVRACLELDFFELDAAYVMPLQDLSSTILTLEHGDRRHSVRACWIDDPDFVAQFRSEGQVVELELLRRLDALAEKSARELGIAEWVRRPR